MVKGLKGDPPSAVYDYTDDEGVILFQVLRYEPKRFVQRRPTGALWQDEWDYHVPPEVPRPLYHLRNVAQARHAHGTLLLVEGEKDVHTLERHGFLATTHSGGSGAWKPQYAEMLKGVGTVVVLPDNDVPGREWGTRALYDLGAAGVPAKHIELEGLPEHGDVTDWLGSHPGIDLVNEIEFAALDFWTPKNPGVIAVESIGRGPQLHANAEWANFADFLKQMAPLPQLVGRELPLQRDGDRLVGLCPFHYEKSPSLKVWSDHFFCMVPETRVLKADLSWTLLGDLRVGDELLAFDEHANGQGHSRRFRHSEVLELGRDRQPCVELLLDSGQREVCTTDHRFLVRQGRGGTGWARAGDRRIKRIIDLASQQVKEESWVAGYMAGILDGEGSLATRRPGRYEGHAPLLTITQKPGLVLDTVMGMLEAWKIRFGLHLDNRGIGHITIGGKAGVLHMLSRARPPRLLSRFDPNHFGQARYGDQQREQRVDGHRAVGHQDIVTIKTSTGTFIADGLASHNCFGCGERGDVFDWVTRRGMADDFVGAMRVVAAEMNVSVPRGLLPAWELRRSG